MTGIILLAAGQSKRMGTPKQQLAYNGTSLLGHAIATAAASNAAAVITVLGFEAKNLQPAAVGDNFFFTVNTAWASGMGSSISTGMQWLLLNQPSLDSVLVMLCDQPLVTTALLNTMMQANVSNKGIIASLYDGSVGVPALFSRSYFSVLAALTGETGAKKIIKEHSDDVVTVDFPGGIIDVDTIEDYKKL